MSLAAKNQNSARHSRSAQLMRALGRDADAIWKALSPDEAERLKADMDDIDDPSTVSDTDTAKAFMADMADPFSKELPCQSLSTLDVKQIGDVLAFVHHESPQVTALVLSLLPEKTAAATLQALPKETAVLALHRVLHMEGLHPRALKAVETAFEAYTKSKTISTRGLDRLAGIMNMVDSTTAPILMAGLDEIELGSADRIRSLMFTFDDLASLDPASLQTLLAKTDRALLIVALQEAKSVTADAFYRNMTSRAGEVLRSEIETSGPYRRAEIEEARREIAALARKLARRGDLLSASHPDQDLVE
ncbi:MAG: FliG C-terminal domain-containing protein [Pseudomonadota bacterium]